jgi:hypothetical protein
LNLTKKHKHPILLAIVEAKIKSQAPQILTIAKAQKNHIIELFCKEHTFCVNHFIENLNAFIGRQIAHNSSSQKKSQAPYNFIVLLSDKFGGTCDDVESSMHKWA